MAYLDTTGGAVRQAAAESEVAEIAALALAIPTAAVADIPASTNLTAVPASFDDLAAVRTYLAAVGVLALVESRLDALEAKVNDLLAKLRTAAIIGS